MVKEILSSFTLMGFPLNACVPLHSNSSLPPAFVNLNSWFWIPPCSAHVPHFIQKCLSAEFLANYPSLQNPTPHAGTICGPHFSGGGRPTQGLCL